MRHFLLPALLIAILAFAATPTPSQASNIQWVTVQQATEAPDGEFVYTRGRIISVMPPRPESAQPWSVYLADSTGQVRLVIFQDTWNEMPDTSFIKPGTSLDVYGVSGQYRGIEQIEIRKQNHIRVTPGTATLQDPTTGEQRYFRVDIGALNMTTIGRNVRVQGIVVEYTPPPRERWPHKVILEDRTGSIEVVYWEDVDAGIEFSNKPEVGKPLEIRGVVNEYRGEMQIRVDTPEQVTRQFEYKGQNMVAEVEAKPDDSGNSFRR